jgi:hypothetical protein
MSIYSVSSKLPLGYLSPFWLKFAVLVPIYYPATQHAFLRRPGAWQDMISACHAGSDLKTNMAALHSSTKTSIAESPRFGQ